MLHALLAIPLGLAIGLSLGTLGGGGSILTVPALVYVLGESAGTATAGSLVIVGAASLAGAASHARAGHVRWRAGSAFGLSGIVAAYLGSRLSTAVNPDVLLLAFAGLMVVAAAAMLLRRTTNPDGTPSTVKAEPRSRGGTALRVLGAGLVVGFLTGFFGVGGGFVIVPGLVFALGYEMPVAVATSLLVIAVNTAVALVARIGHTSFDVVVLVPFIVAAAAGALAGRRVADRVSARALTRSFALLLLVIAAYVAVRAVSGLRG